MPTIAGVLLALSVAGLVVSFAISRPRTIGASFSAQEVGTASESQRQILADGIVTLEEITAAYESDRSCLQEAGYSPGPAGVDGPGTGFTVTVDYSDEANPLPADRDFLAIYDACEKEYVSLVARACAQQDN